MDVGNKTTGGDAIQNVHTAESEQNEKISEHDSATLRRIPDKMPKLALLILAVEVRPYVEQLHEFLF